MWPLDKVTPYDKNPRSISERAVAKVAVSIREYGFQQPIVVDKDGVIIVGHTRFKAAAMLGLTQVPIVVANLPEAKARAYRLADNRTHQETDWLDDLLKDELAALKGLDFDLTLTGFDERELDKLLMDDAELARAEETPPIPENPVTVKGDVWVMGNHRVCCGDSTIATDVEKALAGVKPHLMTTDPPYGVNYKAGWRNEAMPQKNDPSRWRDGSGRATGEVLNDDKADWREVWALFPGEVAYVWHAGNMAHIVAESLLATGFKIRAQIIWAKSHYAIGRGDYHPGHEPCWYAVKEKAKNAHYCGDRTQSTLWKIDKPQKSETGHSTQKPVECMRKPIMNNSSPGQVVFDPFLGSGTTVVAGEMCGRHVYGLELNPAYCDVIVQRWQDFSGGQAILEGDGRTFDEIKAERLKDKKAA